ERLASGCGCRGGLGRSFGSSETVIAAIAAGTSRFGANRRKPVASSARTITTGRVDRRDKGGPAYRGARRAGASVYSRRQGRRLPSPPELPVNAFVERIRDALAAASGLPAGELRIEQPRDPSLGDFAFPCFPLAKALKKAPPAIAGELAVKLSS